MLNLMDVAGLINDLNIVKGAYSRMTRQDDPAAVKLAEALDEIYKSVDALDEELVRYLSLHFHPESPDSVALGRKILLGMEVGRSRIRLNEARGHCHKIANIYQKYVRRWFQDLLQPAEAHQLKSIFDRLTTSDGSLLQAIDSVTWWLQQQASNTLDQVELGNLPAANQLIGQARNEIKPMRVELIKAMNLLRGFQADLIYQSGTV